MASQVLIESVRESAEDGLRLPTRELEEVVLHNLNQFLTDESKLMDLMENDKAGEVRSGLKYAKELAKQLSAANASDKNEILNRIDDRITIYRQHQNQCKVESDFEFHC